MRDFGYDVADYCDVDPIFGTLADFDALIARAHALGLKVLIDQVYAHTSDLHDWFVESRSSRTNRRADWYVWADAKADGSPPSNWQSVFGGPAWTWDARRCQYYLHNFLKEQPQLNGHHPDVQQALIDAACFWLDRGVDGFRVDAINFAMHNPALTDNPPAPDTGKPRTRPFDYQLKIHNQSQPQVADFLRRYRTMLDSYGAVFTVAEVGGDQAIIEMKAYTAGEDHLNSAYGFDFLYAEKLTPAVVAEALAAWPDEPGMGWPSWAFANHDAPRWISRWAPTDGREAFARVTLLLFIALRGNIIVWQGEELGLTQVNIPFERLQDPEAIANWPLTLSRDGARTPMVWSDNAPHGGFSSVEPWLPVGEDHALLAVARQDSDPDSLLNVTRRLIALRQTQPALRLGQLTIIDASGDLLLFTREWAGETLLCAFNLGATVQPWAPPASQGWDVLESVGNPTLSTLPAFAGLIARHASHHR
jgi:alpha-glucosidase